MTQEIYSKLKAYVKAGGHLVMYLPHLSTETDRSKPIKLFSKGDFSDLFGVKVIGRGKIDVQGIKCVDDSLLKSYRFPRWRISTDPRFLGRFTPARLKLTTGKIICSYCNHYRTTLDELLRQPFLIENSLGKGTAFLVAAWEFPGDEGLIRFTDDILRTVLQGEQGSIRILTTDRVRYAVYKSRVSGSVRNFNVVYLLNTCPDTPSIARLWVRGRLSESFILPANELRIAYLCGDMLLLPKDKRVDLTRWKTRGVREDFRFFSAMSQKIEIHNVGKVSHTVCVNDVVRALKPGCRQVINLRRTVDSMRKDFFAPDFLEEPT